MFNKVAYLANFYEVYPSTLDVSPLKHQRFLQDLLGSDYIGLISGTLSFSKINCVVDKYLELAAFNSYYEADSFCLRGVLLGKAEYKTNFSDFLARHFRMEAMTRLYDSLAPEYKSIVSYFVENRQHDWNEEQLLKFYSYYTREAYKLKKCKLL